MNGRNELRIKRKLILCPVCGNRACKCSEGSVEVECSRCRNTLVVNVNNEKVLIFLSRRIKERV